MDAEECLRAGDVQAALLKLQQRIRAQPANVESRIFLFQLLAVQGAWGRASNQLDVLAELDAATLPMVQAYREAIRCEALRTDVFAGRRSPLVFGDPEEWMALILQALSLDAAGHAGEAARLREQAYESAPATAGQIDGEPFTWIADADSRMGPFLEAIIDGKYYWIPFCRVGRLQLEAPVDLRDLIWAPAQFTWANGGQTVGFIPSRYPGSESSADGALQLARKTEWQSIGEDAYAGLGQRILATDSGDYSLLDIRDVQLDPELAAGSGPEVGG